MNPRDNYSKRLERFNKLTHRLSRTADLISNLRIATVVTGIILTGLFYKLGYSTGWWVILAITGFLYILLVIRHNKIKASVLYLTCLLKINENSLKRLNGEWKNFDDCGADFKDQSHNFTDDLDVFGPGSVFQWINTAQTFMGRLNLKEKLSKSPKDTEEICKRQVAIAELATNLGWRQRLTVEGMGIENKLQDPRGLIEWASQYGSFFHKPLVKTIIRILPLFTLLFTVVYFLTEKIPFYIPLFAFIFQGLILYFGKSKLAPLYTVGAYSRNIGIYKTMLRHFERKSFKSEILQALQQDLLGEGGVKAAKQIESLAKITDVISNRDNAMFLLINILTLWDYQCMLALENWKLNSGRNLHKWLEVIGEVEALSSLAVICHDNPDWVLPTFADDLLLSAKEIGHPLLSKECITNDVLINSSKSLLITGSNMSGKSTFLRTAGTNLILAYTGAPVCAKDFCCSLMNIYTCMRVSDNLEKSISSFYAEILRIKEIVAAFNENKRVFFLLDEIFKGTNSKDRHLGAKILIKKLISTGAIGMVSTHDLELAELEKESGGKVRNYHFKEFYVNNKLSFDYKLRPGVSTTRNALYLMKMAGIEIEDSLTI